MISAIGELGFSEASLSEYASGGGAALTVLGFAVWGGYAADLI